LHTETDRVLTIKLNKMKTKHLLPTFLISALLLPFMCLAQSDSTVSKQALSGNPRTFDAGANVLNVGIGIGGDYYYWGPGYVQTPDFVLSYENGTFGNIGPGTISLGGLLDYTGTSYSYVNPGNGYTYTNNWNYWILGFRSAYHWNFTTSHRFDPYAGLMLGYYFINYSHTTNDPHVTEPADPGYVYYSAVYSNYLALSVFLGARYYVSNNVGLWAELGYGYSNLAIGVNFRL
jgi:hypothetical protein